MINEGGELHGYLPTKMQYEKVVKETDGYFSIDNIQDKAKSTEILSAMVKHYLDMEQLIHKNFLTLSEDKVDGFMDQNNTIKTLRGQFEELKIDFVKV